MEVLNGNCIIPMESDLILYVVPEITYVLSSMRSNKEDFDEHG